MSSVMSIDAVEAEKTTTAPTESSGLKKPSHGPEHDDILSAYMNRSSGHGWNEHQYFVKAMEDLHRSQQDKMARVSNDHHWLEE